MKKIILMAVIFFTGHFAIAQNMDTIPKKMSDSSMHAMKPGAQGYYITLQAGQVMLIRDGKAEKLDADKLLKDGTVVTTDGKVKKTDGTIVTMKEGDRVYLEGGMKMSGKD